ncbi:MAG: energy-coupling factor ABC transporter permease [Planctomycetaceae bacterium]
MTLVLLVQALLFSDGGLLSLGANILHMSVIGCWGGYAIYLLVQRSFGTGWKVNLSGAALAAWLTLIGAAGLFCLELYASLGPDEFSLKQFSIWMFSLHAVIGVGEAIITLLVLKAVAQQRPDLILKPVQPVSNFSVRRFALTASVSSLLVTFLLAPWASASPDGLEAAVEQAGLTERQSASLFGFLSDYEIPWVTEHTHALSVGLAGALGVISIIGLAYCLGA